MVVSQEDFGKKLKEFSGFATQILLINKAVLRKRCVEWWIGQN
jgi:hypothetical protein